MGAREAAARLRHDLGKAIRFSAPEVPEEDTEALRSRLRFDVAMTRREGGLGSTRSAAEVFDAWLAEEGAAFREGTLAERVAEIERAVAGVRRLVQRLELLSRCELEALDALTREVAAGCRELVREARARVRDDG